LVNLLRRDDLPDKYDLYAYSDVHVGAKSCHLRAFKKMLDEVKRKKKAYALFLGDAVEGQTTDHPHYDHTNIDWMEGYDLHTPDGQFELFQDLLEPVAGKHLGLIKGNHDWRFDKTRPFIKHIARDLDIPYLGPRAHLMLNGLNVYASHKGKRLPKGAKDPGQRRANREAALKRYLEPFWGSAHLMMFGDTHELLVRRPLPPHPELLSDEKGRHTMRSVPWHQKGTTVKGARRGGVYGYVDPEARWYAVTGTFRRSGLVQDVSEDGGWDTWDDYAERFAYSPMPCGYVKFRVEGGEVVDGWEVVV
jgi:hypothetical protein